MKSTDTLCLVCNGGRLGGRNKKGLARARSIDDKVFKYSGRVEKTYWDINRSD